jgi:hypothetical protein
MVRRLLGKQYSVRLTATFPFGKMDGYVHKDNREVKLGPLANATKFHNKEEAEDCAMYALAEITGQTIAIMVSWDYQIM